MRQKATILGDSSVYLADRDQYVAGCDLYVITYQSSGPTYRVESLPAAARARPTAAEARARPSRLLMARLELVPFAGRAGLLEELSGWLGDAGPASVRLVHGPGGQGKSRLAAEFARRRPDGWLGWQARQAPSADHARDIPDAHPQSPAGTAGLLVVVDYADRWAPPRLLEAIIGLYATARRLPGSVPLRVLLLARAAGFWWEALTQRLDTDYEIPATAAALPPLGGEVSRVELFTTAFDHFAAAMGVTGADGAGRLPTGLGGRGFGPVLTVHMAALAAVDAHWRGAAAPAEPARISAYLLKRERGHWREWNGRAEDRLPTGPEVMGHAVYAATLTGPLSHAAGAEVLARATVASVPDNVNQILTDHGRCYPPEDPATVLEPLYPDRLGEDFIALTTPRHDPGAASAAVDGDGDGDGDDLAALVASWAGTAVGQLLIPAAGRPPAEWTVRALTALIETGRRWRHIADDQLYPLLRAHPSLVLQAGGPVLSSLAALPDVDLTVLEAIEALLPRDRHIDLDAGIAALAMRLADHRLAGSSDRARQAVIYNNLSYRLRHAGLHQRAQEAAHNATQLLRQLAAADHSAALPDLALALHNEALTLGEVGRRAEAVPVSAEAVRLRRELTELDRAAHLPDLALSLANHTMRLQEVGRLADALDSSAEAVDLHRGLAEDAGADHLPGLAMALNNRSAILAEAGLARPALDTSTEAVDLYRSLARTNHNSYLPDLAMALTNHAMRLLEVTGRRADAAAFSQEAVALFRELTDLNRSAHLPSLAMALSHAARLVEPGQPVEPGQLTDALAASAEAVVLFRELTDLNPAAHLHTLGMALNNRAALLAGTGNAADAFLLSGQSVDVYRELVGINRAAHLLNLAIALATRASLLTRAERLSDAVPVSAEALDLFGQLPDRNRDVHRHRLATVLRDHGALLARVDRATDAVPFAQRSVDLLSELADRDHDIFPDYAQSAFYLGWVLAQTNRDAEAIAWMVKAFLLCQRLREDAQGLLEEAKDLLRYAYAQEPAVVASEFHAQTGGDIPSWLAEPPAPQ